MLIVFSKRPLIKTEVSCIHFTNSEFYIQIYILRPGRIIKYTSLEREKMCSFFQSQVPQPQQTKEPKDVQNTVQMDLSTKYTYHNCSSISMSFFSEQDLVSCQKPRRFFNPPSSSFLREETKFRKEKKIHYCV